MPNNSATGGYLLPTTQGLPGGLTLDQFIQTVIVGISNFAGTLVRPTWQQNSPPTPDIGVDWIAYGITQVPPNAYAYTDLDESGNFNIQRHEGLEVRCFIYGPNAMDNMTELRDGFQIQQNLEALTIAKMGFTETLPAIHAPELINEQWFDRYDLSIILTRLIQRTYPVLSFVSATGTLTARDTVSGGGQIVVNLEVTPPSP